MSSQLIRLRCPPVGAAAAAAGLALTAAACSSSSSTASGGTRTGNSSPVTISVDCAPPAAQEPVQNKEWLEDVALFEKANPNITVKSVYNYPCENNQAVFTAMLRGGTETNLYQTYLTDLPHILLACQAANITQYVNSTTVPTLSDIVPGSMKAVTAGSTIYGLPTANYTHGLIYNRKLFTQAGLNPDQPPTTWAQVETDATAISKLGNRIEGWGDYSAGNNGGWHFSSYIDALLGSVGNHTPSPSSANFNNANGQAILQAVHALRFTYQGLSAADGPAPGPPRQ